MKTRFRSIITAAFTLVAAFISIVYVSSCNRDRCKTIVCAYHGVCNEGVCTCPAGYEGTNCETISRTKFLGNWSVFEKGSTTEAAQYGVDIREGKNVPDVVIDNFFNYFRTPIKATINMDTITIPNQQYEGKVLFGVGYVYTSVTYGQYGAIVMRYEIVDTATNNVDDFGYYPEIDHSDPSAWNK